MRYGDVMDLMINEVGEQFERLSPDFKVQMLKAAAEAVALAEAIGDDPAQGMVAQSRWKDQCFSTGPLGRKLMFPAAIAELPRKPFVRILKAIGRSLAGQFFGAV